MGFFFFIYINPKPLEVLTLGTGVNIEWATYEYTTERKIARKIERRSVCQTEEKE